MPDASESAPAGLVVTGHLDRGETGGRWFDYERRPLPSPREPAPLPESGRAESSQPKPDADGSTEVVNDVDRIPFIAMAIAPWLVVFFFARIGIDGGGRVLVPLAALATAATTGTYLKEKRPHEAWIAKWLVLAVLAKITAAYLRYMALVIGYGENGDATGYDSWGRRFSRYWSGIGSEPQLDDLQGTDFIRYFTGIVYWLFGTDMLAGFFIFAAIALVGSYAWYRAVALSLPNINTKLYFLFAFFIPSIAFWPSSIGKEALMQFAIGLMALSTALLLRNNFIRAAAFGAVGGYFIWSVRPHLLALVVVSAAPAYLLGRGPTATDGDAGSNWLKPVGILLVVAASMFAVTEGASFLGIESLSLESIEAELDEQTARSSQGGSEFDSGSNAITPLRLPSGLATTLFRPFPWEATSPFMLLAALEGVLLAMAVVWRWRSLLNAVVLMRKYPFLLFCLAFVMVYALAFSSFANFGLLVRQRSLELPALLALLVLEGRPSKTKSEEIPCP